MRQVQQVQCGPHCSALVLHHKAKSTKSWRTAPCRASRAAVLATELQAEIKEIATEEQLRNKRQYC